MYRFLATLFLCLSSLSHSASEKEGCLEILALLVRDGAVYYEPVLEPYAGRNYREVGLQTFQWHWTSDRQKGKPLVTTIWGNQLPPFEHDAPGLYPYRVWTIALSAEGAQLVTRSQGYQWREADLELHPREGKLDQTEKAFSNEERALAERLSLEGHWVKSKPEHIGGVRNSEGTLEITRPIIRDVPTSELVARMLKGLRAIGEYPTTQEYEKVEITFEIKTPEKESGSTQIVRQLEKSLKKGGQSPYVVIDARNTNITEQEALRAAKRVAGVIRKKWDRGYGDRLRELRIVGPDYDHLYVFFNAEKVDWEIRHVDREI